MRATAAVAAAGTAALLAGCGGAHPGATARSVTVAKYGAFPADTISTQAHGDPRPCRAVARSFSDGASDYVAHLDAKAGATPADTAYMLLREQLSDFDVRGCRTATLSAALATKLTPAERRTLVANLPQALARRVRAALAGSGS